MLEGKEKPDSIAAEDNFAVGSVPKDDCCEVKSSNGEELSKNALEVNCSDCCDNEEFQKKSFISHKVISKDTGKVRYELVKDHLQEVAAMAADFARPFGTEEWAYAVGLAHDIGKYSKEFQNRILNNGPKCDHSTAGAWEMYRVLGLPLLSYCVAGHHSGLPDGGTEVDIEGSTLNARFKKAKTNQLPNYEAYIKEIFLSAPSNPLSNSSFNEKGFDHFALSFLLRMIFSCLVDADYLCTERFILGRQREKPSSENLEDLLKKLEKKIKTFYPPQTVVNEIRCEVLEACDNAAYDKPGVFSLTVPTGGGKTYASLLFALRHACVSDRDIRRIIYAIPYTSIIEQNAEVFREVLGGHNILEHHSDFDFSSEKETESEGKNELLRLSSENWDSSIVVTTNVQLFESLFANKPSRCRKLHNIANSVIVLDEAQMIPTGYIKPCIRALSELVHRYGCTVVLCTATQPSVNCFFKEYGCEVKEIIPNPKALYEKLKRVDYLYEGELSDDELAKRISLNNQVLCVVNSRKQASNIFHLLKEEYESEGIYRLSTLMHPIHRKQMLREIKNNLKQGKICRVVSTSLIEAGVDVDFPVVYRALAGLDSVVQCAGRCNREGKRDAEESIVHIFEPANEYAIPNDTRQKEAIARSVLLSEYRENFRKVQKGGTAMECDMGSLDLIDRYFNVLHDYRGKSINDGLDASEILNGLNNLGAFDGVPSIPFKSVSDKFRLIEEGSFSVVIPDETIRGDLIAFYEGYCLAGSMRRLARHSVGLYKNDIDALKQAGAIELIGNGVYVLLDLDLYSKEVGLDVGKAGGKAVCF